MAIIVNGILCDEIVDGLTEGIDFHDGPTARKGFICNWADRFTVGKGLLGANHTNIVGGLISVSVPAQYPEVPYMYAHTIEFEPKGSPVQGAAQVAWPKVIVWANYKCMPWSFSGLDDPSGQNQLGNFLFAEQQLNSSIELVTVTGRSTKFKASGKPTGTDYAFRLAIVEMLITLHRVPYLPTNQVLGMAGYINSQPFLGVNGIGKLLFNGVKTHRTRNFDGTTVSEVTYSFSARTQRWDYAFDPLKPGGAGWDQVVQPDGTTPFIPMTDLSVVMPGAFFT